MLGYFVGGGALVMLALHPDLGVATTSRTARRVHRVSAALASALALATIVSGWAKLASPASTAALIVLLAGLGWRLRLPPSALGRGAKPEYFGLPPSPRIGR